MKKVLLLSVFISLFVGVNAKVLQDKLELNGDRYTQTYGETVATKGLYRKSGGLERIEKNGEVKWYLKIEQQESDFFSIDKGRIMLIKLKNGEIIELKNVEELKSTDCEIITVAGVSSSTIVYELFPRYEITKDQMLKMYQIGTEKIRVETNSGYEDYSAGMLAGFIKDAYREISDQCEIKNDIYYNF